MHLLAAVSWSKQTGFVFTPGLQSELAGNEWQPGVGQISAWSPAVPQILHLPSGPGPQDEPENSLESLERARGAMPDEEPPHARSKGTGEYDSNRDGPFRDAHYPTLGPISRLQVPGKK